MRNAACLGGTLGGVPARGGGGGGSPLVICVCVAWDVSSRVCLTSDSIGNELVGVEMRNRREVTRESHGI